MLALDLGLALGVLGACSVGRMHQEQWLAYHVLTAGWAMTALGVLTVGWMTRATDRAFHVWVVIVAGMVLGLAVRGIGEDPLRPWWPAG